MQQVLSIIITIIILGVVIIAHEGGHFWAGRWLGFKIAEFAIGFGPKLLTWKRKETLFSLRLIPLGGFCRYFGEDEDLEDKEAFQYKPVWKRFIVVFAGAFMNMVLAVILAITTIGIFGAGQLPVVAEVSPHFPAEQAGLAPGDRIIEVNGTKVASAADLQLYMQDNRGETIQLKLLRNEKTVQTNLTPIEDSKVKDHYIIGITFVMEREKVGFFKAVEHGFVLVGDAIKEMLVFLKNLIFQFKGASDIGGPVMIVGLVDDAISQNAAQLIWIALLISINLGVFNLLPLPALDGSRLAFLLLEGIRRKKVNPNKEGLVHFIGFVILVSLMVVIFFKDIVNLISR